MDLITLAFDLCFISDQEPIQNKTQFEHRLEQKRGDLIETANKFADNLSRPLAEYHAVAKRLSLKLPLTALNAVKDIQSQLSYLVYQGFIHNTPEQALKRMPLYFQAIGQRLDKMTSDPMRDKEWMVEVQPHWQRYLNNTGKDTSESLNEYRWMIEEFRISLFAQGIKTAYPISAKRLEKQWAKCRS
jgi:ATP-dependent helicase HrpA